MASRSVLVDLADWTKLSTLITAKNPNLGSLTNCQSINVESPETNADGTRVDITMDLVSKDPAYRLLKEEDQLFESPLRSNNISTLDKLLRIVDNAGAVTAGKARITLNFA